MKKWNPKELEMGVRDLAALWNQELTLTPIPGDLNSCGSAP